MDFLRCERQTGDNKNKQVKKFHWKSEHGKSDTDIRSCSGIAKIAFQKLKTKYKENRKMWAETKKWAPNWWVIWILLCHWMLDNLLTEEEKTWGKRGGILQKEAENTMDGLRKHQKTFRKRKEWKGLLCLESKRDYWKFRDMTWKEG